MLVAMLGLTAGAIGWLTLWPPAATPVVEQHRARGVVTSVGYQTRLDKRAVARSATVRLANHDVRVQAYGRSLSSGDRVTVLVRTHADGSKSHELVGAALGR